MEVIITIGITCIIILLFYRFVERKHKILFFKIVGVLLILCIISFGSYLLWEKKVEREKRGWISVKYINFISDVKNSLNRDHINSFMVTLKSKYPEIFANMSSNEIEDVIKILFKSDISTNKSKELILDKLKDKKNISSQVDSMFIYLENLLNIKSNELNNITTMMIFDVCNKRKIPLYKTEFNVSGYKEGRSTPNNISKNDKSILETTKFTTDNIIEPGECTNIMFGGTDRYLYYDRYEIRSLSGEWKDGETVYKYF